MLVSKHLVWRCCMGVVHTVLTTHTQLLQWRLLYQKEVYVLHNLTFTLLPELDEAALSVAEYERASEQLRHDPLLYRELVAPTYLLTELVMQATASTVINVRASAEVRDLIDSAASVQGKTRTDFMLEASSDKAKQVLLDQTLFNLNEDQFWKLQAMMNAPLQQNAAMMKLLSKKSPWEK